MYAIGASDVQCFWCDDEIKFSKWERYIENGGEHLHEGCQERIAGMMQKSNVSLSKLKTDWYTSVGRLRDIEEWLGAARTYKKGRVAAVDECLRHPMSETAEKARQAAKKEMERKQSAHAEFMADLRIEFTT